MLRRFKIHPIAVMGFFSATFLLMLLFYPKEGISAAMRGITIWWDILFPALFPFFVIAELMLGFGIVHFFGTLLDPLMRPVFRVPGIGGFVLTMAFASGYPIGARLTSQLWDQRLITREEGERLVAFTTTSDPIFLIGAVSVGFFHNPGIAVILGVAHYGTALLVGLLMRYHGKGAVSPYPEAKGKGSLLAQSFNAMHVARLRDGRPFGVMLQQAIRTSIQLVFVIGGLVVFFSAVLEMLDIARFLQLLHTGVGGVLHLTGFPVPLAQAIVDGWFEVTLGAKAAGGAYASIPLMYKAAACAFILSWAGLSVHAQIVSLLHRTNLRYAPFFFARLIHGILSAGAVVLLWNIFEPSVLKQESALAAFAEISSPDWMIRTWSVPGAAAAGAIFTAFLLLLACLHHFHIKMNGRNGNIRK